MLRRTMSVAVRWQLTRWISFAMRPLSTARRGESKFLDDHVTGADKPGGVVDRRDCELRQ
jgi:hypothetical protein